MGFFRHLIEESQSPRSTIRPRQAQPFEDARGVAAAVEPVDEAVVPRPAPVRAAAPPDAPQAGPGGAAREDTGLSRDAPQSEWHRARIESERPQPVEPHRQAGKPVGTGAPPAPSPAVPTAAAVDAPTRPPDRATPASSAPLEPPRRAEEGAGLERATAPVSVRPPAAVAPWPPVREDAERADVPPPPQPWQVAAPPDVPRLPGTRAAAAPPPEQIKALSPPLRVAPVPVRVAPVPVRPAVAAAPPPPPPASEARPVIDIRIGRVDVRAVEAKASAPPRAPSPAPALSLDAFLKNGGRA